MKDRPWYRLVGAAIPVIWLWFVFIGVRWNIYASIFIAIASTILLGTLYSILESSGNK